MTQIREAVFPVAGFGTRFLPATKAMPKELLPIVDKPLIQYAAEEAIAAGIDTLIWSLRDLCGLRRAGLFRVAPDVVVTT
jgi:UTP-glucose-1-phosphate uridylyltransferase